ncbi:MAG TPA: hypothetical protein VEU55_05620 [Gemmatimonadales bacterium]|nr:hypothetical protein [Gemmatimonadales bacterium]
MASPALTLDAFRARSPGAAHVVARPAPPARLAARRSLGAVMVAAAVAAATLALLAALPFLALVRLSVFLYLRHRYPTWLALAGGVAGTVGLVTLYAAWVSRRLTGRLRLRLVARRVAAPLVLAYCGYALLYSARVHTKSDRVRAYYAALHPLLRLGLATLILADRDLVVTDVARRPEDYSAMRLAVNDGSLHYAQRDGYVHAADLRTSDRSWLTNRLVQLYFLAMGFDTLRHVGTADHLHVELALR